MHPHHDREVRAVDDSHPRALCAARRAQHHARLAPHHYDALPASKYAWWRAEAGLWGDTAPPRADDDNPRRLR